MSKKNTSILGGPRNGHMPKQSVLNYKDSSQAAMRSVLKRSWNKTNANSVLEGETRITTPYRAVNNLGDFLERKNYVCGGSNPSDGMKPGYGRRFGSMFNNCGKHKAIQATYANVKWVSDSSDYIKFKKQQAYVKNYNDLTFGGHQQYPM